MSDSAEQVLMRRTIELARKCKDEHTDRPSPRVAAIVVKNGQVIGEAHRGQFDGGDHAEFCLLEKVLNSDHDISGTTVYTTLEPCSSRNHPKIPCARRLANRGVREVVIGIYDPDPRVNRKGWEILRDAGVRLRDFPEELRNEIRRDNSAFLAKYTERRALTGDDVCFDYKQNDGKFLLGDGAFSVLTQWSMAGHDAIYALGNLPNRVALAKYAKTFTEIDDPSALDFSSYSVFANKGEIAVFRSERGDYALVQVGSVLAGSDHGDEHTALSFVYEIRQKPK